MTSMTLIAAQAQREAARLRFRSTLETIQNRLSPAALTTEAVESVKESATIAARAGVDTVRNNPGKVAAGLGLVGLFLARKPIARAFQGDAATDDTDEYGA